MDQELVDFLEQRFETSERRMQEHLRTETRQTHVLIEDLRGQMQLVAEGVVGHEQKLERFREEVAEEFRDTKALLRLSYTDLEHRMKGLEARVEELDSRLSALERAA